MSIVYEKCSGGVTNLIDNYVNLMAIAVKQINQVEMTEIGIKYPQRTI